MIKLENANELKKGDKVLMIETQYDFSGKEFAKYENELVVERTNKKSISVFDKTLNIGFKLLKDYQFGKTNIGIKKEFYLITG